MGMTATDVIKAAMAEFIDGSYNPVGIHTAISTGNIYHDSVLTRNDILEIVNTAVSTLSLPNHDVVMTIVNTAIDNRIVPLIESHTDRLAEIEAYIKSQLAAVKDELIPPSSCEGVPTENQVGFEIQTVTKTPTTTSQEKPDGTKTWCGFFEMIGMTALTATEAQKKESIDVRTQQSERGIELAKEQGLGEWAVKRAGREFVRVDATPKASLPLFPN